MKDRYLFKAKRIDNGEWVEGDLVRSYLKIGNACITDFSKGIVCGVDEETICQYTELVDYNLNEIWEHDIVRCFDYNSGASFLAVVEFGNPNGFYSWGYQLKHIEGDEPNLDILLWIGVEETGAKCEVIGNIFDNPELVEGGV